ncbi:MAG: CoA ester lyase [Candidatus Delongbacteria bacterium]|jgi:citrate lyase subunit beta/citryl-CoA lyase|nr:CoA ester lyase [Candidatus Delongbacteria bacterium]
MKNQYLLRSLMFVPAHNERLMNKAVKTNADVLLLDIEDSVLPRENKQAARDNIKKMLDKGEFGNHLIFPRVNDRESGELLKDIHQLTIQGIDGFMYPKSQTGEDIYFFDKLLETIEYEKHIPLGTFKIIPLIETASAVLHAEGICKASDRVIAIAFGCEDFITDLEGIHDIKGDSIFTARSMIAMAARATGRIPVDTVHINIHDLNDLEKNLQIAKNLGFEGMLVLHHKELDLAHQYFSPSEKEVEEAKYILQLSEEARKDAKGVAMINGKFIGPPMVNTAQKTLEKHTLIKEKQ